MFAPGISPRRAIFLYLLDSINLARVVARERRNSGADVIILDRDIYGELNNLNLQNGFSRAFIRPVQTLVPQPDIAYLLDADPDAAFARKPEYPLEFMKKCRQSYFNLAALLGGGRGETVLRRAISESCG